MTGTAVIDSPEELAQRSPRTPRERLLRTVLTAAADGLEPVMSLYQPYVEGLEHLPADGRFLLVGNHTQVPAAEIILIPYFVRQALGKQVRALADRQFGKGGKLQADLLAAYGAVIGSPEAAAALMAANEPILVFPGGGREIAKFKGEQYQLRWDNRYGFARVAIEHQYPIVTAALIGGDDLYTSMTTRDGLYGRASEWISRRLDGRPDMAMPLLRGVGPTLLPRAQRMYLRFGPAITTTRPADVSPDAWIAQVKEDTAAQLEADLLDLQNIRAADPYRALNPLAWRSAARPAS
ncbi:lysophospholipid acyltransferase family protein [Mycolicibacter hiberniae]|uniref:Membrane protein n=1 Tax=Mycolicibacter hiberniae TaxID=29314 RepID=A0A7I7X8C9_9MYCO|nr:lysophospholipid acyltransferase family protein [Mycolicibacter hiberniae]MCV7088271.1 acyltransferase family protein [Mycolicibacter hiberniae]ORV68882.1 glycerol acyltransferase [Mycolicibacter hiberniae]BBZ25127.1 membrane protein [Mycolicibacter hiberniae]